MLVSRFLLALYQQDGLSYLFVFNLLGLTIGSIALLDQEKYLIKRLKVLSKEGFIRNAIVLATFLSLFSCGLIELVAIAKPALSLANGTVGLVYTLCAASISGYSTLTVLGPYTE